MVCCVLLCGLISVLVLCFITVNYYYLLSYSSELLVLSVDQPAMSVTLQSIVLEPLERYVYVFCVYVCVCVCVCMCVHACACVCLSDTVCVIHSVQLIDLDRME